MAHPHRPAWTAAENERLHQLYPTTAPADLVPLFPGRNAQGIKMQASRLKIAGAKVVRSPRPSSPPAAKPKARPLLADLRPDPLPDFYRNST